MQTKSNAYTIFEQGWLLGIQPAQPQESNRTLVLVHGWTGDEHSMAIFGRGLAEKYWMLFPRGPVKARRGGYGWVDMDAEQPQDFMKYQSVARTLADQIDVWRNSLRIGDGPVSLMGFSQGAAVILTMVLLYPDRYEKIAALAGYLPADADPSVPPDHLQGKVIYMAHGARDETVPVERARRTVEVLRKAGANVNYCEDDVGHKLSALCFNNMKSYLLSN